MVKDGFKIRGHGEVRSPIFLNWGKHMKFGKVAFNDWEWDQFSSFMVKAEIWCCS